MSMNEHLLSELRANGQLWMTPADMGAMLDIDRRIKDGDESGWRGDPSMGLFYNQVLERFEVWGFDRAGKEYLAAAHDKLDITLVHKLRDGDPRKNDVFQRVIDNNMRLEQERARKDAERLAVVGDKLAWGIRQDFGQHLGGRKTMHAIPTVPKMKEKADAT